MTLALDNIQPKRPTPDGWGTRWRIQNDLADAYQGRGDWLSIIALWNSVAQEYQQSGLFNVHFAQLSLMDAYGLLGQWAAADQAREKAEAMLLRLRSTEGWTRNGFNALNQHNRLTAHFFARQGDYAEAERRHRAALEWAEKYLELMQRVLGRDNQTIRIARANVQNAKTGLGDILSTRGKYGEAEAWARAGLEGALALYGFNTGSVSYSLVIVGWARFQQGDIAGAERYYRHALAAAQGAGIAPHSTMLASRRAALANAQIAQGRWDEALKLFAERDRGLRSDAVQFKQFGSNHVSWAYAVHKSGQSQRAANMADRLIAYELKRTVPNQWNIAQQRGVLGMALAASGRTADALKSYQDSIPQLIRRDQDDATAESTGYWRVFWQQVILESYLDLLAKLKAAGESPANLDLVDESFRIADIARGSSVQEAITATAARAQLPDKDLAELARREQDALNRIVALNRLLGRLAAAPGQEQMNKVLTDMRAEIERLRKEHAALRLEINKRFPEYAELISPKPVALADVRGMLAPGEAVLSIYLGESKSYVWTIAAGASATFRVVPVKRAEIENSVRELRKAVDFGDGNPARLRAFDVERAYNLYRTFLEPDEPLWKDAQVLNVIPHGALGQLPFGLLVTAAPSQQPSAGTEAAYHDVPWLVRKVALAQLPSASAFVALRRAPPGKADREAFIGFGDPLFMAGAGAGGQWGLVRNLMVQKVADGTDEQLKASMRGNRAQTTSTATTSVMPGLSGAFALLSALPDTSDELHEIAVVLKADPTRDIFVNRNATEKNVKQARLANRRVVAFATHGIAPGELTGLDQPALALANPALTGDTDNDGFLTMEEVLGLKLDADWVVLSACNTASGDGAGAEAVSGLGRAFFYAGARSLLVSNWAVETISARLLTTELFRRQSENPKLTRAEALRKSMLVLMERRAIDPAAKQPSFSYAHPAFWAPFSLVGDGGAR